MGQLSSYTNTFTSGTVAKADEVNQNFTDIKNAHNATDTAALYKDGTKAMTGNLAMGANKVTGLANGTSSTDAVNKGQLDAVENIIDTAVLEDGSVPFLEAQSYFSSSVTAATNATPIVITSAGHGRSDNDYVLITGVLGNTAANGEWQITYIDANSFSLAGSVGNGSYTSGGTVYFLPSDLENVITNANLEKNNYIVPYGTLSSGSKTLQANKFHTANFTGATTLNMPTISTNNVFKDITIEFTTDDADYPTFSGIDNWDYGATPVWSTTQKNLVYIYCYDGSTFNANYRQLGA